MCLAASRRRGMFGVVSLQEAVGGHDRAYGPRSPAAETCRELREMGNEMRVSEWLTAEESYDDLGWKALTQRFLQLLAFLLIYAAEMRKIVHAAYDRRQRCARSARPPASCSCCASQSHPEVPLPVSVARFLLPYPPNPRHQY